MSWVLLIIAGLLEVVWASSLNEATTFLQWVGVVILIAISFIMLIYTYKKLPVAVAYSIFVGIGTVGTYIVSVFMGHPFSIVQGVALLGLVAGIIGLKIATKDDEDQKGVQ